MDFNDSPHYWQSQYFYYYVSWFATVEYFVIFVLSKFILPFFDTYFVWMTFVVQDIRQV